MLKNALYKVNKMTAENDIVEAIVSLDKTHDIFKGHFPGQPVLPGVCMMQMVRELLETYCKAKLQLRKADDIRFSAMVDPTKDDQIKFQIQFNRSDDLLQTKTKILKMDDVICCKMKATFHALSNQ